MYTTTLGMYHFNIYDSTVKLNNYVIILSDPVQPISDSQYLKKLFVK